ncbi:MAG: septum formation protein Maf [Burkholderiaceae bacterium]|nr:septum formation protein Maf [Burkholderiaceae bacterium]
MARTARTPKLLLASQSPRRKALLQSVGLSPIIVPTDPHADPEALEIILPGESPASYVQRVATLKRDDALRRLHQSPQSVSMRLSPASSDLIIAADTTVALGMTILGKPQRDAQARDMLADLSGKTHQVFTAVSVSRFDQTASETIVVESEVTFAELSPAWIDAYVASGEPMDKAGGYGIQGAAGALIPRIAGSYSGIMGMPLYETLDLIRRLSQHG